jgi:NAD(P)H-hydrate epimerase
MKVIGSDEVKKLKLPKPDSHKRENGRLLIISGSKEYFGALLYAVKTASRLVDLIYVLTTKENQRLVSRLKSRTAEFMPVENLKQIWSDVDAVLIGPGLGVSRKTKNLVKQVLKSGKRAVLDADALSVLDKGLLKLLGPNHILTPHRGEFRRVFKVSGNSSTVKKFAKLYNCTIILKGPVDIICTPDGRLGYNQTGNAGMTKGGTGDVLAGLVAAFYCKNDAFTSAAAGAFVNGKAGDELYKKVGPFYDAEDLVEQIPKTMWKMLKISN